MPLRFRYYCLGLFLQCIFAQQGYAAACCGGGFALPSLIVGDDAVQVTGSISRAIVQDDVSATQSWRKRRFKELNETYRLEAVRLLSDRWQIGVGLPIVRRSRGESAAAGVGDLATTVGFEFLPDWDYSPWRPKGMVYFQGIVPLGRSVYEAESPYQLDARGRGFWALGSGVLFTKAIRSLDAFLHLGVHRAFSRELVSNGRGARLEPGWGGVFGTGLGWSFFDWRLGAALDWSYEDPIAVQGLLASRGALQRFSTFSLSASYLVNSALAVAAAYSDQTIFGRPSNTSLSKSFALSIQKRWPR